MGKTDTVLVERGETIVLKKRIKLTKMLKDDKIRSNMAIVRFEKRLLSFKFKVDINTFSEELPEDMSVLITLLSLNNKGSFSLVTLEKGCSLFM